MKRLLLILISVISITGASLFVLIYILPGTMCKLFLLSFMTSDSETWHKLSIVAETIHVPEQPQIEGATSEFCGLRFCTPYGEPAAIDSEYDLNSKIGRTVLGYNNSVFLLVQTFGPSDPSEPNETSRQLMAMGLHAENLFELMKQAYSWKPDSFLSFPNLKSDRTSYLLALLKSQAMPDCSAIYLYESKAFWGSIYQLNSGFIIAEINDSNGISHSISFENSNMGDVVKVLSTVQFTD